MVRLEFQPMVGRIRYLGQDSTPPPPVAVEALPLNVQQTIKHFYILLTSSSRVFSLK
ncbi:MAG TPA: hypothetical protein VJ599_01855 [Nitrososphaeraceae archaeon]|nr:hypothetical protein [Nitrososphaeraceae archaeon]